MITNKVFALTHSQDTLTSALAENPTQSPGQIAKNIYGNNLRVEEDTAEKGSSGGLLNKLISKLSLSSEKDDDDGRAETTAREPTNEDLDRAADCGKFGKRPSDLFLKIYHDVLCTLDHDPWAGMVSPPLLGSTGVIPLSIISVIPDIMQHHYDCIILAQSEVFLATNFWQTSASATKICDALIELSNRAQKRDPHKKVVVKLMYDRGSPKQVRENHIAVSEEEWTGDEVKLPRRSEIPGLEFEVVNYHRPILGTFHSKYCVIDRRIALLNSNNIQDRPNVEMLIHLEGPIVDSFYDMALLSWYNAFQPPLPCLNTPYQRPAEGYKFGMENPYATMKDLDGRKGRAVGELGGFDAGAGGGALSPAPSGTGATESDAPLGLSPANTETGDTALGLSPDATVSTVTESDASVPPTQSRTPGPETDQEQKPFISGADESISDHLNAGTQDTKATQPLDPKVAEFEPHVLHAPQEEFPIAMVNRKPHGTPGHGDTNNPQDVAWLAGLKYAQKRVFMQTPTFNAKPIVAATLDAVRRGVECVLYVDVGFNDGGEALPYQGGTNEEVAKRMYAALKPEEKSRLQMFWYTGKDQNRPINAKMNQRNCHVKLAIFDDIVAVQGNGNQDAQSWFHSQEINVLIDNPEICREWQNAIRHNQNTHLHGRLDDDGVWRDKEGHELPDSTGIKSGPGSVIKGVKGSIARVRGKGGF